MCVYTICDLTNFNQIIYNCDVHIFTFFLLYHVRFVNKFSVNCS